MNLKIGIPVGEDTLPAAKPHHPPAKKKTSPPSCAAPPLQTAPGSVTVSMVSSLESISVCSPNLL